MKQIKVFVLTFALWTVCGMLSKILFLTCYGSLMGEADISDYIAVLWNGAILDSAIAGYLTIIPTLLLIVSLWYKGKVLQYIWNTYFAIVGFITAVAYVSNIGLYGYWGFPLDNTPLLYLKTSPSDAFASLLWWQWIVAPAGIILISIAIYAAFAKTYSRIIYGRKGTVKDSAMHATRMSWHKALRSLGYSMLLIVLGASLIIPIRGGLSTGTNHTGTVYFSENIRLNHAAVNPVFSFFEAVNHQENIATKYRFMDDGEATKIFSSLTHTQLRANAEKHSYNVVIVCLESFSKYIMTESGHVKGVTPNLDKLSEEGVFFTNIYASSFRTDRGLVSVLSGLPAQPTMSVMDMPRISTSLPSLAKTLAGNGYDTHFYYGGDTNYSNMKSYIVGTGFNTITAENDFPAEKRICKWGVPDHFLLENVLDDIKKAPKGKAFFKAIMTGSSHEPYDAPYKSGLIPELNAFAYADNSLGMFIDGLKKLPVWENTLVVLVPDHFGVYPLEIDNYKPWRYEIPLILTGGVIKEPRRIDTLGSQVDISATVLGMLGLDHSDFIYSRDLFDDSIPHFAFFSIPDAIGAVDDSGIIVYDNTSNKLIHSEGTDNVTQTLKAKAYVQKLYDDLAARQNKTAK